MIDKAKALIEGSVVGSMFLGLVSMILLQAGCNFTEVQWGELAVVLLGGPTAVAAWRQKYDAKQAELPGEIKP
jgi:hypothetical protein